MLEKGGKSTAFAAIALTSSKSESRSPHQARAAGQRSWSSRLTVGRVVSCLYSSFSIPRQPQISPNRPVPSKTTAVRYISAKAWQHLESTAGPTMVRLLKSYVHAPIAELLEELPAAEQMPELIFNMTDDLLRILNRRRVFSSKRSTPKPSEVSAIDDEMPEGRRRRDRLMRRRLSIRSRAPKASSALVRRVMQANTGRDDSTRAHVANDVALHGLRYRVDARPEPSLRCSADLHSGRAKSAFVDGCYWHGCSEHFTVPKRNAAWWAEKIADNCRRDVRRTAGTQGLGLESDSSLGARPPRRCCCIRRGDSHCQNHSTSSESARCSRSGDHPWNPQHNTERRLAGAEARPSMLEPEPDSPSSDAGLKPAVSLNASLIGARPDAC